MMDSAKTNTKKWLLIPMEVVEREISGKLLICQEALNRGWGCIVGTKAAIRDNIEHLPEGVVLLKSIIVSELDYMRNYKALGHKLACLDEEGLVQNNLDHMVSVRATPDTIDALDAFLFWGKTQKEAYSKKYPQFTDKYHVTSNPRADLWGKKKYAPLYEEEMKSIKAQYGPYFIIPTSFGTYNHFMGKDGALSIYKVDKMVPDDYFTFLKGYREYVKNIYYGFTEIIEPLTQKFPGMNFVVRPHPSENRKPWDELAKNHPNVHVVFSGGVTPWLAGAEAILHCGSTTAVEGHLLGVPVISYCRDYNDPAYDLVVPAKSSINVTQQEQVFEILQQVLDGQDVNSLYPEVAEGHEWLKDWIDGIDSYEASQTVIDALEALNPKDTSYKPQVIPEESQFSTQNIKEFIWRLLAPIEHVKPIMDRLPFRIKQAIRSRRYGRSKTKNIDLKATQSYLDALSSIDNSPSTKMDIIQKNLVVLTR